MISIKTRILLIVLSIVCIACLAASLALPFIGAFADDVKPVLPPSGISPDSLFNYSPVALSDTVNQTSSFYYNLDECAKFTSDSSDYKLIANLLRSAFPSGSSDLALMLFDGIYTSEVGFIGGSTTYPPSRVYKSVVVLNLRINAGNVLSMQFLSCTPSDVNTQLTVNYGTFLNNRLINGVPASSFFISYRPVSTFDLDLLRQTSLQNYGAWSSFAFSQYVTNQWYSSDVTQISLRNMRLTPIKSLTDSTVDNASAYYYLIKNGETKYDNLRSQILTVLSKYMAFNMQATYIGDKLTYDDGYQAGYGSGYNEGNIYGQTVANNTVNQNSASWNAGYNLANQEINKNSASWNAAVKDTNNTVNKGSASWNAGYNAGASDSNNYSFLSLVGAVFDAPLQAFTNLFNFDLFGVNMTAFLSTVFVLLVFVTICRLLLGG